MATKLLPTRDPAPIPEAFSRVFIEGGWRKAERMYGKRAALTWYQALDGNNTLAPARREKMRGGRS